MNDIAEMGYNISFAGFVITTPISLLVAYGYFRWGWLRDDETAEDETVTVYSDDLPDYDTALHHRYADVNVPDEIVNPYKPYGEMTDEYTNGAAVSRQPVQVQSVPTHVNVCGVDIARRIVRLFVTMIRLEDNVAPFNDMCLTSGAGASYSKLRTAMLNGGVLVYRNPNNKRGGVNINTDGVNHLRTLVGMTPLPYQTVQSPVFSEADDDEMLDDDIDDGVDDGVDDDIMGYVDRYADSVVLEEMAV